jgi:17beta-estradiol 17-dehydrogenase / very-long-chain 3-oxoacyl-CoA reductase
MIKKLGIALNLLSMLYPKTAKTLQVIGLVLVAKNLLSLLSSLYKVILRRRRNFKRRYGENSWALVTGSSDGIGKAIAFSLARQGFNIILSARTEFKLDMVRVELRRTFSDIDVKVLVADYANSHLPGFLDEKMSELDGLDISIVVNNVGVDVLDHYQNLSEQQITNLVNLNCFSVTLMNRIFIPRFRARHAERGFRSAIVNVSSLAGTFLPI